MNIKFFKLSVIWELVLLYEVIMIVAVRTTSNELFNHRSG